MVRLFTIFMLSALSMMTAFSAMADEGHGPSVGAKGMAGALGVFSFKPDDWKQGEMTYWSDTDGVNPGAAGCHVGTDKDGNPNGRMFGEACLSDTLLVESNPGVDVVHAHSDDVGHPDKFDCDVWCKGQGSAKGICVAAPAPPCAASAKCSCE
ncbi:hypothetical protein [Filomicrobium sp.]|uniref:hypothetical protein n=1 Tax=Filomicrobium sp. TaxID=2024831 RepID=UPI0025882DF4|nr:hypothetical protein [Filomicrobium sp.]MCV0368843.1 hypothetical protein [Filomicrobium sp.]